MHTKIEIFLKVSLGHFRRIEKNNEDREQYFMNFIITIEVWQSTHYLWLKCRILF